MLSSIRSSVLWSWVVSPVASPVAVMRIDKESNDILGEQLVIRFVINNIGVFLLSNYKICNYTKSENTN
jgi:hypothetical protein